MHTESIQVVESARSPAALALLCAAVYSVSLTQPHLLQSTAASFDEGRASDEAHVDNRRARRGLKVEL